MKPNISCIDETLEMPLWNNSVRPITNKDKMLDIKELKPCGMLWYLNMWSEMAFS